LKEAYSGYKEILTDSDAWALSSNAALSYTYYDTADRTGAAHELATSQAVADYILGLYLGTKGNQPTGIQQGAGLAVKLQTEPEETTTGFVYASGVWKHDPEL